MLKRHGLQAERTENPQGDTLDPPRPARRVYHRAQMLRPANLVDLNGRACHRLLRTASDEPDWVFEAKYDGFRALSLLEPGVCRLVSRRGHAYRAFGSLCGIIATTASTRNAILDGETVCPRRRPGPLAVQPAAVPSWPASLRRPRLAPLVEQQATLARLVPSGAATIPDVEHIEARGGAFFQAACERDLEGSSGRGGAAAI
jgi:ATP-dependent DNA ligase